jgi:hypothetical protein
VEKLEGAPQLRKVIRTENSDPVLEARARSLGRTFMEVSDEMEDLMTEFHMAEGEALAMGLPEPELPPEYLALDAELTKLSAAMTKAGARQIQSSRERSNGA